MQSNNELLADVAGYYTAKLAEHGDTPLGVDWNGIDSQTLRFRQLCKIIKPSTQFSLNDFGCGYGALCDFLAAEFDDYSYVGIDVAEAMVVAARKRHENTARARFVCANEPDQVADYCVASGVFNVCLGRRASEWRSYLEDTLHLLDQWSTVGFAFNCLTAYSDVDKMRDHLYYADPCAMFDLCKKRYAKNVALLHDYGLYEFTIHVRKIV